MLNGYDLEVYDSFKLLPVGLAAAFAAGFGAAGAVVGMAEVWYIGMSFPFLEPRSY